MKTFSIRYFLRGILIILFIVIVIVIWRSYNSNVRLEQMQYAYHKKKELITSKSTTKINLPTTLQLEALQKHYNNYLIDLKKIDPSKLSLDNQRSRERSIRQVRKELQVFERMTQDPSYYDIGLPLRQILDDRTLNNQERFFLIESKLETAKLYYEIAKQHLHSPDFNKIKPAIQIQLKTYHFLQHEMIDALNIANLTPLQQKRFLSKWNAAKLAIKDYLAFCRSIEFEQRAANMGTSH